MLLLKRLLDSDSVHSRVEKNRNWIISISILDIQLELDMRKIRVNFFLCRLNVPFNILQNICFWLFLWKSEVKSSVSSPSISTRSYLAMLRCCRDYQSRKLLVTRDDGEAEVMSNYSSLLLHWSHPLSLIIYSVEY